MSGRKFTRCTACGWKPARRPRHEDADPDAAIGSVQSNEIVHVLAARPELRDLFPLADAVDQAVRA